VNTTLENKAAFDEKFNQLEGKIQGIIKSMQLN
jgi:hypothetical protein